MTENEMLAGDLLTACTLLAIEKELADDLADALVRVMHERHFLDTDAAAVVARYREARQQ